MNAALDTITRIMSQLPLENWQRDPFAGELDSEGMPQLMLVPTSAQDELRPPHGVNVPPIRAIPVVDMKTTT